MHTVRTGRGGSMDPSAYGGLGDQELAALTAYFGCLAGVTILMWAIYLWLFYRIFTKAGYSGWLTLLNLIPGVGQIVVIFMLAFGDWPALRGFQQAAPPAQPYQPPYTPPPPVQ